MSLVLQDGRGECGLTIGERERERESESESEREREREREREKERERALSTMLFWD